MISPSRQDPDATAERGRLFLIPSPLGDNDPAEVIPAPVLERLQTIHVYVVEEVRTVRRYLSRAGLKGRIDTLEFHTLNEHTTPQEVESYLSLFDGGTDVGLISEAGLPAVADPGAQLVALCHRHGIEVVPFVGPSSLMLALMASGLNGQRFAFQGYLPAKPEERRSAIRDLEKRSAAQHETELCIETPYRNDSLLQDLLAGLRETTRLTLAADITLPTAWIRTKTVRQWKADKPVIGKRPCVFLILA